MPNFKYKARDRFGKQISGAMEAKSEADVSEYLKKLKYTPVSIAQAPESEGIGRFLARFKKIKQEDLIIFTKQLYTLQKAGLPLISGLDALKNQTENRLLQKTITDMMKGLEAGASFSDALSMHPRIFSELYVNMVRAGEASGLLDETLFRLSELEEYDMQTRTKIKAATRYPLVVIITLAAAFLAVVTFVLPKFAELFTRFNVPLPLPTKILLFTNYLARNWWHAIAALTAGGIFLFRRFVRTSAGRFFWDGLKLKIPVFGPLILKILMSRFSRITSMLVRSGIPVLQVLNLVGRAVGNAVVARTIKQIELAVREGKPMAEPMKVSKMFPAMVIQMVSVGENTGKIDELLEHVSDHYDMQADYALRNLTTAIEPILIFLLAIMVLIMALAIFLPLWDIISIFKKA